MREVGLESNGEVLEFAAGLLRGEFDLVLFLTGVGVRAMVDIAQERFDREEFLGALCKAKIGARSKAHHRTRGTESSVHVISEEPSTWREFARSRGEAIRQFACRDERGGSGIRSIGPEFLSELSGRCRTLTKVPVYQWTLPEDLQPLRESILRIAEWHDRRRLVHDCRTGDSPVSGEQMSVASQLREALQSTVVLSIGPTTSEELAHYGIQPDFEPSRPKMGFLVNEAAQYSARLLEQKRNRKIEGIVTEPQEDDGDSEDGKPVRRVEASTPTMAGFRDGLRQIDSSA